MSDPQRAARVTVTGMLHLGDEGVATCLSCGNNKGLVLTVLANSERVTAQCPGCGEKWDITHVMDGSTLRAVDDRLEAEKSSQASS